ncbi:unnamed protein product [Amoebophrya sp. A120]|nr:unnamed protein product [Amoebophrya sp. A120]|eukprot:GSA120T00007904001.1
MSSSAPATQVPQRSPTFGAEGEQAVAFEPSLSKQGSVLEAAGSHPKTAKLFQSAVAHVIHRRRLDDERKIAEQCFKRPTAVLEHQRATQNKRNHPTAGIGNVAGAASSAPGAPPSGTTTTPGAGVESTRQGTKNTISIPSTAPAAAGSSAERTGVYAVDKDEKDYNILRVPGSVGSINGTSGREDNLEDYEDFPVSGTSDFEATRASVDHILDAREANWNHLQQSMLHRHHGARSYLKAKTARLFSRRKKKKPGVSDGGPGSSSDGGRELHRHLHKEPSENKFHKGSRFAKALKKTPCPNRVGVEVHAVQQEQVATVAAALRQGILEVMGGATSDAAGAAGVEMQEPSPDDADDVEFKDAEAELLQHVGNTPGDQMQLEALVRDRTQSISRSDAGKGSDTSNKSPEGEVHMKNAPPAPAPPPGGTTTSNVQQHHLRAPNSTTTLPSSASRGDETQTTHTVKFRIRSYQPAKFAKVQKAFHIPEDEYKDSFLHGKEFYCISTEMAAGRSPAFFLLTTDQRFILKSCTAREEKLMLEILPDYAEHVEQSCGGRTTGVAGPPGLEAGNSYDRREPTTGANKRSQQLRGATNTAPAETTKEKTADPQLQLPSQNSFHTAASVVGQTSTEHHQTNRTDLSNMSAATPEITDRSTTGAAGRGSRGDESLSLGSIVSNNVSDGDEFGQTSTSAGAGGGPGATSKRGPGLALPVRSPGTTFTTPATSLLPQYFGLYKIEFIDENPSSTSSGKKFEKEHFTFVCMANIFCGMYKINCKYDLKGSTVGRKARKGGHAPGPARAPPPSGGQHQQDGVGITVDPSTSGAITSSAFPHAQHQHGATSETHEHEEEQLVLKDLDWIDDQASSTKLRQLKTVRNAKKCLQIVDSLERDVAFLQRNNLLDYSLLVGLHFKPKAALNAKGTAGSMSNILYGREDYVPFGVQVVENDKLLSYIGIVDILTTYGLRKRAETCLFCGTCRNISCQPPATYGNRFLEFARHAVFQVDQEVVEPDVNSKANLTKVKDEADDSNSRNCTTPLAQGHNPAKHLAASKSREGSSPDKLTAATAVERGDSSQGAMTGEPATNSTSLQLVSHEQDSVGRDTKVTSRSTQLVSIQESDLRV